MNKKLVITLKSDLCVASGDGFSSGIDIDVCYDDHGFPFILGRRIKGCLREVANDILPQCSDSIFGSPRRRESGCLKVGNAVLPDLGAMTLIADSESASTSEICSLFTRVRAQTAIEGDSVKDGTLRFIRVVNHYSPITHGELEFEAPIEIAEEHVSDFEMLVRGLRNIGYRRNRGFGAIKCRIEDACEGPRACSVTEFPFGIAFAVKTEEPLMLPRQNNESLDHVPGSAVLGFFAAKAQKKGMDAETFEKLFLSDAVRFSPLYPVDAKGERALPAFGLIAKIKGSGPGSRDGECINLLCDSLKDGEQPKPLKSGFLGSDYLPLQVEKEVTYHCSMGDAPTLYTQEVIRPGQVFAGFIFCPESYRPFFSEVLRGEPLSFGRSKSAQYSKCCLEEYKGSLPSELPLPVRSGDKVVAVLDSDVLLDDGCGGYSGNADLLIDAIARETGLANPDRAHSLFKYRVVSGYNAKWNQKKPHVFAFAAGSYCTFEAAQDGCPSELYLGRRRGEGFGRVVLKPVSELIPSMEPASAAPASYQPESLQLDEWRTLLREAKRAEELRLLAIDCVKGSKGETLNASFVGRVLRMIVQSESRNDLMGRIASIRNVDKKAIVEEIVSSFESGRDSSSSPLDWRIEQDCLKCAFTFLKYRVKRSEEGCLE